MSSSSHSVPSIPSSPSSQNSSSASIPTLQRRTRSERVAPYSSKSVLNRLFTKLRQNYSGRFILSMVLTSFLFCLVLHVWNPPFAYRRGDIIDRAIVCKTPFSMASAIGRQLEEARVRREVMHIFVNDPAPLVQLQKSLGNTVAAFVNATHYDKLDAEGQITWLQFLKPRGTDSIPIDIDPRAAFDQFLSYFRDEQDLDTFNRRLKIAFTEFELHGLLTTLRFGSAQGNQDKILVYQKGHTPVSAVEFKVNEVLLRDGIRLRKSLQQYMSSDKQTEEFVSWIFNWLFPQIPSTLREDTRATAESTNEAVAALEEVRFDFVPGQIIVEAGTKLTRDDIILLKSEYLASLKMTPLSTKMVRSAAMFAVILAILLIIWGFICRVERRRPKTPFAFFGFMMGMVCVVGGIEMLREFSLTNAHWEILALMIFVMLVAVTYSWEFGLVYASLLVIVLVLGYGRDSSFITLLLAVIITTAMQLGRLRTRRKLVDVGVLAGIVAFIATISLAILTGHACDLMLLRDATINFLSAIIAGLLMSGLLPLIEKPFGILTDMMFFELGDVSHPLLQRLIQAAPATYGHSMQVGAIAETAADAIGARGLLTRIGAYFHDVGKIIKPEYYSENQGGQNNIHDTLKPQVSTIVVIAHVKDGVDLAKKHHLPTPVIDLIEQHHGTSLVSFFYGRASSNAGKDDPHVEESTFRYPGPKPKSKEAAILMIADASESACRSMGAGATPKKIENKVHLIIKQKLDDGQFDDSGLTLNEIKVIENSVIKSIIAAMHGRIQYPGQDDSLQSVTHVTISDATTAETPTDSR
ncbi:MAG: HD family phosphohydrolase [Thermoguttaceae bacterium]